MAQRTNREWLDRLRGPEQASALAELREKLLRGLRFAFLNRSDVTEADLEDFAQEALVKIVDALDTFRGESRFTTWAQKIAVRVALTELRRSRWQDLSLQELIDRYEGDFTPVVLTDPSPSPERRATQQALLALVQRLIDEVLTERQRQAITAVVIAGLPITEAARRLDTNRNALYKLLHDARVKLREQLLARGFTPQEILDAFER